MPNPLQRLIAGFESFRREYFERRPSLFEGLVQDGQRPKVLVIACSDSRVDPAILTRSRPGDLFTVRNVAAIVPPYVPDGRPRGTSSAVEFGVRGLEVEHLVVLGHAMCGGMRALAEPPGNRFEFLSDWVEIASEARDAVDRAGLTGEARQIALEQAGVLCSLRNLLTFPWIRDRVETGRLVLHGWYFGLRHGELLAFDPTEGRFVAVRGRARPFGPHPEACEAGCGCGPMPNLDRFAQTVAADPAAAA